MQSLKDMTPEQRAVLRACEDRFDEVLQVDDPKPPTAPPVWVRLKRAKDRYPVLAMISANGTVRSNSGGFPGVPIRLYGAPSKGNRETWGEGVPKHAQRYLDEEKERFSDA